jgi:hypothetical protein
MSKNEFETICSIPTEFIILDSIQEKSTNTISIQDRDPFTLAKQPFLLHMYISGFAARRLNPK